jgi:hypothetical protein
MLMTERGFNVNHVGLTMMIGGVAIRLINFIIH